MRADVVLAGVGGQGVVTIARLLAEAALADGLEVLQGELHGMSQRGGAVHAQLRLADTPLESPQVPRGGAGLLLGLEPVEALRSLAWLAPTGRVVTAMRPVENVPDYPPLEDVLAELRTIPGALLVDAHALAVEAGSARSENFVMAGAAAAFLPIRPQTLRACIERRAARWAEKDREAALRALEAGLAAVREGAASAARS